MPIVTIKMTREAGLSGQGGITTDQKNALIAGASQLLLDVMDKPLASTFVVIEEVDTENWGVGGVPVKEFRRRQSQQSQQSQQSR